MTSRVPAAAATGPLGTSALTTPGTDRNVAAVALAGDESVRTTTGVSAPAGTPLLRSACQASYAAPAEARESALAVPTDRLRKGMNSAARMAMAPPVAIQRRCTIPLPHRSQ